MPILHPWILNSICEYYLSGGTISTDDIIVAFDFFVLFLSFKRNKYYYYINWRDGKNNNIYYKIKFRFKNLSDRKYKRVNN